MCFMQGRVLLEPGFCMILAAFSHVGKIMIEELPALDKGLTRAWQQMAIPEVGASLKDGVPNFPGPQIFFFLHPLF